MALNVNEDNHNFVKLAQFYTALREKQDNSCLERILHQIDDINCQIPNNSHIGNQKPELIGSTLLHLAQKENNYIIFDHLLDLDIDYTIKNNNKYGSTALLQTIEDVEESSRALQLVKLKNNLSGEYSNLVLSAHVNQQNSNNPCNNYGISHFHVACILNNVAAIEFFLINGISVDEAIDSSSPILPGYSPLHLVTMTSTSLETIKLLLEYGANINCKDARGLTPLHILIERRLEIIEIIYNSVRPDLRNELQMIDQKIPFLLEKHFTAEIDDTGLTHLHIACILPCTPMLEQSVTRMENVNQAIKSDSAFFPGFTPLHFAMLFESGLVTLLLRKEANIFAKAANGTTPLDICLEKYSIDIVHSILSSVPGWCNILMSDGRTKLLDVILAMRSINTFNYITEQLSYDVNAYVPIASPIFRGFSTLQLAVFFSNERQSHLDLRIVNSCLHKNAYLYWRDSYGSTAIHLAFRLHKINTLDVLLRYNVSDSLSRIPMHYRSFFNVGDGDNLSITHIAVAANHLDSVDELLVNSIFDIDSPVLSTFKWFNNEQNSDDKDKDRAFFITEKSTLLHVAVATGNVPMTQLLLEKGANVYATDVNDLTPIHRVLMTGHKVVGHVLLSISNLEDRVVKEANLSHLHVACYLNKISAVERLVNSGSDINAVITCTAEAFSSLSHFDGYTPIHIAMREDNFDVVRYLLGCKADILAGKPDGSTPLYQNLMDKPIFYSKQLLLLLHEIWGNKELLKHIENDTGLTRLHLACHVIDLELIQDSLKDDVNVNSRAYTNSPIWPGCTALHIFITYCVKLIENDIQIGEYGTFEDILKLLLSNGADVSVSDNNCESALHLADTLLAEPGKSNYVSSANMTFVRTVITEMLSSIKNFTVNPKNNRGISLFHIACKVCHVDIVKKYLEHGCDVNQPIDYYSCNRIAGYTPLHLLTSYYLPFLQTVEAIELLLSYNADCNVKDILGNTPLHTIVLFNKGSIRESMLRRLISHNADVNLQNLRGENLFEIALKSSDITAAEVQFLLDSGFHANTYNPFSELGCLPNVFNNMEILDILLNSNSIQEIDYQGRTAIHNIVSTRGSRIFQNEYFTLIQKLIKLGCDLDHQDQLGRTALHLAVHFDNLQAVCSLLVSGADINILDATNNSPAFYTLDIPLSNFHERLILQDSSSQVKMTLHFHLYKLRFFNLDVIEQNIELLDEHFPIDTNRVINFSKEITDVESLKVGLSLIPLRNFLSETGIVASCIPKCQRGEIDEFFETDISKHQFQEIESVLRLQYRKVLKRHDMMEPATNAIQEHFAKVAEIYSLQINNQNYCMPQPCCERILRFLTTREVDNLIASIEHSTQ